MFILRSVFLFYLPEEGQFCETHLTKNMEICIISSWNANTLLVFMCTVAVYTNKGVLKLPLLLDVVFSKNVWKNIKKHLKCILKLITNGIVRLLVVCQRCGFKRFFVTCITLQTDQQWTVATN